MQKEYIRKKIDNMARRAERNNSPQMTDFLDPAEQAAAEGYLKKRHKDLITVFFGGFSEAERKRLLLLPQGYHVQSSDFEMVVLEAVSEESRGKITHRDILGALMGSGIRREKTGDIIMLENGAAIIIDTKIAGFLETNFPLIRNVHFSVRVVNPGEYELPEVAFTEKMIMVPSLRLDSVIQKACHLSRGDAQKFIESGKVKVDHVVTEKSDHIVNESSVISIRTKGRIVLQEILGKTKKDNFRVLVKMF